MIGSTREFPGNTESDLLEMPTTAGWYLHVKFEKGRAVEAYLWQPGLDL
jgi:hypothetical protein